MLVVSDSKGFSPIRQNFLQNLTLYYPTNPKVLYGCLDLLIASLILPIM